MLIRNIAHYPAQWRLPLLSGLPFSSLRSLLALLLLCTITASANADNAPYPPGTVTSHGYAVFGKLKYGPDFTHLEYTNPTAPKGGFYRHNSGVNFDSLNHYSVIGSYPFEADYFFDPLMERTEDEPVSYYGVIARTITYPKDLSWVEFELRPEARWHDGTPITVEDVLFTLELLKNDLIRPQMSAPAKAVTKAYQTGPHRVRMELNQKNNPTLPALVAELEVLPKRYFATHDLTKPTLEPALGSGPYRVENFLPGRSLDMVRVKDYWAADIPMRKGRFNFDRIQPIYLRDMRATQDSFQTGRVHLSNEFAARRWKSEDKMTAYASGEIIRDEIPYKNSSYYASITMNARSPFLGDRRVRKAITLAYDFEFVRNAILHGHHGRTESYFSNTEFEAHDLPSAGELKLLEPYRGSLPAEVFTQAPHISSGGTRQNQRANLKQARDLLAEAGYRLQGMKLVDPKTGKPVVLDYIALSPLLYYQAGYFIQNMKRLGIEVRYRSFDNAQYRRKIGRYEFDLMHNMLTFGPKDAPGVELMSDWSSASADIPNRLNRAGIKEPAIDNALDVMINAHDRQTVVDAMRVIDRVGRANYYSIPLQHAYPAPVGKKSIAYWDRFGRPEKDVTYFYPFLTLDHWWWDPEKEAKLKHGNFQ